MQCLSFGEREIDRERERERERQREIEREREREKVFLKQGKRDSLSGNGKD